MTKKIILVWLVVSISIFGFTFDDALAVGEFRYNGQVLNTNANWWTNLLKGYDIGYNEFKQSYNVYSLKRPFENRYSKVLNGRSSGAIPALVGISDKSLLPEFQLRFFFDSSSGIFAVNQYIFSTGSETAEWNFGYYQQFYANYDFGAGSTLSILLSGHGKLERILKPTDPYLKVRLYPLSGTSSAIHEFSKAERDALIDLMNLYQKISVIDYVRYNGMEKLNEYVPIKDREY